MKKPHHQTISGRKVKANYIKKSDLAEFSIETFKRNQLYIYLSLFVLIITVIVLIIIT